MSHLQFSILIRKKQILKKFILICMTLAAVTVTIVSFSADAQARGHRHGHGYRGGHNHHHNNCNRWKMMPYHGHLVGRWICGAGNF